jgi:hypothetical protein
MIMERSLKPEELHNENYGELKIKLIDFGAAQKIVLDENGEQKISDVVWKNLMSSKFYGTSERLTPI